MASFLFKSLLFLYLINQLPNLSSHILTSEWSRNEIISNIFFLQAFHGCRLKTANIPLSMIRDPFDVWHDNYIDFKPNQSYDLDFLRIGSYVVYNPSIVNFSPSKFLFAGRLTWQDNPECAQLRGATELYYCMRAYKWRDATILGIFDENYCTATIMEDRVLKDGLTLTALGYITGWFHGSAWFDTKLLLPIDFMTLRSTRASSLNSVIVATQRTELLRSEHFRKFNIVVDGRILFQIMYIGARNRVTSTITFSRAIYIDDFQEDWATSYSIINIGGKKISTKLLLPIFCGDDAIAKYNITSADLSSRQTNPIKTTEKDPANHRRRLNDYHISGTIKDKNWAPFQYNDGLLWSYTLTPHIICQMEKDIYNISAEGGDRSGTDFFGKCAVCKRRYATSNSPIFDNYSSVITAQATAKIMEGGNCTIFSSYVNFHLNGLPAFKMKKRDSYVGVAHAIVGIYFKNLVYNVEYYERTYIHFFYRMEGTPPFRILKLSKPLTMETDRSVASWFNVNEIGSIAFASGFTYDSSAAGREFVLSYGVGDHYSRVARFGSRTVSRQFQ